MKPSKALVSSRQKTAMLDRYFSTLREHLGDELMPDARFDALSLDTKCVAWSREEIYGSGLDSRIGSM